MDLPIQQALFGLSSRLTDRIPREGARMLNAALLPILTSLELERHLEARNELALGRMVHPCRILVLADIHLGDAVMMQSMVTALRDFFPEAEIHYVVSRSAACFIEGNPEITRLWALYTGGPLPSASDLRAADRLCREGDFDLVVNACPSFVPGNPIPRHLPLLDIRTHAPRLLRNEKNPVEPNHFISQAHIFLHQVLGRKFRPLRNGPIRGVGLSLTDQALCEASRFLESLKWESQEPLVLINPDTASPFTRPPFELLRSLVAQLIAGPTRVLVGEGHTDRGVGRRLIEALPLPAARQTRLVPHSIRAETYAALTDLVDVFVSGDTGPLHWAAARKHSFSGLVSYRNRTHVVSLFGATPARMSGYDSCEAGFLPAWQEASSFAFVSDPPCRNITCLNKLHKTCQVTRCFEGQKADPITHVICNYLNEAKAQPSKPISA